MKAIIIIFAFYITILIVKAIKKIKNFEYLTEEEMEKAINYLEDRGD